jgi:hypothetical protein
MPATEARAQSAEKLIAASRADRQLPPVLVTVAQAGPARHVKQQIFDNLTAVGLSFIHNLRAAP